MILVILCSAILCFYWYWKMTILKHLPSVSSVFPLGHMWYVIGKMSYEVPLTTRYYEFLHALAKIFEKEGMFVLRLWPMKDVVVLCSADYAQVILSHKEEVKKSSFYATLRLITGDGLLSSNGGDKYKRHKRIIYPNFQKKMMERHQAVMSHHSFIMCQQLESIESGKEFTLIDYLLPCTFDIAYQSATGKDIGAQFNHDLKMARCVKRTKDIWNERIVKPWLQNEWFFLAFTSLGKETREIYSYSKSYFGKIVSDRREEIKEKMKLAKSMKDEYSDDVERPCVLDFLIQHQLTDSSPLSDQEIYEEINIMIGAAFETSADNLSWALFFIGQYPEVQKTIHHELDEIFGEDVNREVTYNDINQLQYLHCVLKESMRLYPIVPIIARELKSDLEIGDKLIPKGTELVVFISAIQRNPKYYDNPEEFIPERFLPQNAHKIQPYSYIPFSSGSRRCIGDTFGVRGNLTVLCYMLRRFRIESSQSRDTIRTAWEAHGRPLVPVKLKLFHR